MCWLSNDEAVVGGEHSGDRTCLCDSSFCALSSKQSSLPEGVSQRPESLQEEWHAEDDDGVKDMESQDMASS